MSWAGGRVLRNDAVLETISSYTSQADLDVGRPSGENSGQQQLGGTPSADPELWAAIFTSLEEQSKQRRQQLARHLSDAAPELAGQLRQHRMEQMRCSAEGVTYFEDPGAAAAIAGSSSSSSSTGDSGLVLPSFAGYLPAVREAVVAQLCNEYLQREAEQDGIINCVPGCTSQLVLTTLGDGNCLSHSCSLGMWGVHDRDNKLRNAIHATMAHPLAGGQIRVRFERQLALNGIPQDNWAAEWEREMRSLHDSSTYLSDVHCFTLANVLRRPLIIYGDAQAAAAALSGIYLPSLWPEPQLQCSRQPLAVLFGWSHFSLLCTVQGEGPASPPLLPLSTRDGPLQLRFLVEAEEQQQQQAAAHAQIGVSGSDMDTQLQLLRRYFDAEQLFNGSTGVRLSEAPRPHVMVELLGSIYLQQAAEQQQQQQEAQPQPQEQTPGQQQPATRNEFGKLDSTLPSTNC